MRAGDYKTPIQAEEYYKKRFSAGFDIVNRDEMKILKRWLVRIQAKKKVSLDVGTGTGRILRALLDSGCKKIYALDQSTAMLGYLGKIYKNEIMEGKIQPIVTPSHKIPLKPNSIDFATSFHLFKHLPNIEPTLMEVNKVLKPGGFFIFDVLNKNSLVRFNLGMCYVLSNDQLTLLLNKNGFTVDLISYIHPFGETIYGKFGNVLGLIPEIFDNSQLKFGTKIFVLARKSG